MRLSLVEGSLSQVFLMWTTGAALVGYMLHFGATPSHIALVSSVPLLAQLFSPLAAWWVSELGSRRLFTASLALIGRGLWLLAALAPTLGVPHAVMPVFLIALVGTSSLFQASLAVVWTDWMGDVVPEARRGRYFGLRTSVVGVVGMAGNLLAGWFLDRVAAPLNFQVVLATAVVLAVLAAVLLLLHHDPRTSGERLDLANALRLPWRNPNFRMFLVFSGYLFFGIFLSAALVTAYFLDVLGMSFTQVALWAIIASLTNLLTANLWGRVADRIGNRTVLAIGIVIMAVGFPICWILAGLRGDLAFIWLSGVVDATAWGAAGPALFNLALVTAPQDKRLGYLAMYSVVTGLLGFVGGAVSGPLLGILDRIPLGIWSGYYSLFVLSGVFRLSSIIPLLRVREARGWDPRSLLRTLRSWQRLGFPWR